MENSEAFLAHLHAHRSVRRYTSDAVEIEAVSTIVAAAQRAATSSNLQMASVIMVSDRDRKEELARLCGDQEHIRQAPVFLAWCADRHRLDRVCQLQGFVQNTEYLEAFLVAAVDVAIMMQNATVAAEALGLGTCYIGGLRNDAAAVVKLLNLPGRVVPIAGMTLGVPAPAPAVATPLRPRLPLSAVLHQEQYQPVAEADLHSYDRAMIETGIYQGRQVPGPPMEEDQYGWLEHSARRVSSPSRKGLGEVVRSQGYGLK